MLSMLIFMFWCCAFLALAALLLEYAGAIAGILYGFWELFHASPKKPAAPGDDPNARRLGRVRNLDRFLGVKRGH